jgi:hypothetical protein
MEMTAQDVSWYFNGEGLDFALFRTNHDLVGVSLEMHAPGNRA